MIRAGSRPTTVLVSLGDSQWPLALGAPYRRGLGASAPDYPSGRMAATLIAFGPTLRFVPPVVAGLRPWRLLDVPASRSSHALPLPETVGSPWRSACRWRFRASALGGQDHSGPSPRPGPGPRRSPTPADRGSGCPGARCRRAGRGPGGPSAPLVGGLVRALSTSGPGTSPRPGPRRRGPAICPWRPRRRAPGPVRSAPGCLSPQGHQLDAELHDHRRQSGVLGRQAGHLGPPPGFRRRPGARGLQSGDGPILGCLAGS